MEKLKKLLNKLFCLPLPLVAVMAVVSAVLLIYSFAYEDAIAYVAYFAYFFSAYSLTCVCFIAPMAYKRLKAFKQENKYIQLYSSDARLRVKLSLYGSVAMNTAYALFQLGLGLKHHSVWFYSMAGYYLLLALMRFMLIRYTKNHAPGQMMKDEWKKYRMCGISLLMMTLMLTVFILYFVLRIREFRHHEITTITMAVYTFSALTLAIVNAVRYRKYESPAYSAAKAVSLVSAIVSVLTLENAMLTVFGQEADGWFHQIMLGATGAAVVAAVQGIALYMIINANKKLITIQNRTDRRS